ncbi:hypothetical protein IHE45_10G078300 [Dioscorea alata]|uniref:Uncharacterized protein n=1 Tax=Dioscorea alata TaxID=55571 RepID=A0ACB7VBQ8_DIOAL|nr:hypothetical protein IHE45_10G078300 [Dioscorea alata]
MIFSSTELDHRPSTRFSIPESVTCNKTIQISMSSIEQSMSSTTRIDWFSIAASNVRSPELLLTPVNSKSYTSNLRSSAIAATKLDFPFLGGA